MLNVVMMGVVMLNVVMMGVVMLNVVGLSVVMLSVVAPINYGRKKFIASAPGSGPPSW
jgi:hypothetical protein